MTLDEMLGIDPNDPIDQLAGQLVHQDYDLMSTLVNARRESGLSVEEVAERMGISKESVEHLERYDSDPRLSTLRRYSLAIGALVTHEVTAGIIPAHVPHD